MHQFSKTEIDHFLQSRILNAALDALESKFTRHMVKAEDYEQAKPHWDLLKALGKLRNELNSMRMPNE